MAAGQVAAYLNDIYVFNWSRQTFASDLIFVMPIALCLAIGIAVGHPAAGMIAAGGAMTVGFGSKQSIDRSRLLPMIFASAGIAFSTFVGMVVGHANFILVIVAAIWAFGYGMLSGREGGYGWVGQQCVVTLLVGSAFPFSAKLAVGRALLVLAGGVLQVLWSSAALRLFRQLREHLRELARYLREEEMALRAAMTEVAAKVRRRQFADSTVAYSLRLAVTVGLSAEIYRRLHFATGCWIPMTAMLVLKPGLADTASRAIARTLGTVAGAWAVSLRVGTPGAVTRGAGGAYGGVCVALLCNVERELRDVCSFYHGVHCVSPVAGADSGGRRLRTAALCARRWAGRLL